jgi:hypothetical protein
MIVYKQESRGQHLIEEYWMIKKTLNYIVPIQKIRTRMQNKGNHAIQISKRIYMTILLGRCRFRKRQVANMFPQLPKLMVNKYSTKKNYDNLKWITIQVHTMSVSTDDVPWVVVCGVAGFNGFPWINRVLYGFWSDFPYKLDHFSSSIMQRFCRSQSKSEVVPKIKLSYIMIFL